MAIPTLAGAMLLLTLAYWWQSNLVHELAGIAMFSLVARHVYVNRHWILRMFRGPYDGRRWLVTALHLGLLANMLLLVATSLAISQSVFAFIPVAANVTVRDLHWLGAYWLVITVGIHLGLHWSRVMALARSVFQIKTDCALRRWTLRMAASAFVLLGIWSWGAMGVATKLSWGRSLDFWDFSRSVAPFFAHWASVLALPAVLTHYLSKLRWARTAS
ncbi:DUF4405 domain-containing protein [Devosia riboflavina]